MKSDSIPRLNLSGLRKAGTIRTDNLIRTEPLLSDSSVPLVVLPNVEDLNLVSWAASQKAHLQQLLLLHGGLLFRNFRISGAAQFQEFVAACSGEALEYMEQTSPRHKVHGNIYTSTEYPPSHRIFLHNENSYSATWPMKIMFFCVTAPADGGETPIADVRRVYARIPESIRNRFARDGWMLVRNFGTGYGVSWETAFQTKDRDEITRYCRERGIESEWRSNEHLRIRQRRPAIARHPVTGELVWFNHATFFHISTLDQEMRNALLAEFAEEDLPYNTYYSDGSRIEPEILEILRNAYEAETIKFSWQEHDLLLLDNMLVAHGRSSFIGPRKILVGMTEPYSQPLEMSA
ncbi:MAG TPA: TauD/TfdA family dioxygenase [Candidatus Angelobacter sp.]|nr:TauD/TfdA family dioxygenase [Candidatus Angelobacter sp.]